jgi:hypothetical protein
LSHYAASAKNYLSGRQFRKPQSRSLAPTYLHRAIANAFGDFQPNKEPSQSDAIIRSQRNREEGHVNDLIYLVGLTVVIMAILSFFGLRKGISNMAIEAVALPDEEEQYLQWTPVIAGAR